MAYVHPHQPRFQPKLLDEAKKSKRCAGRRLGMEILLKSVAFFIILICTLILLIQSQKCVIRYLKAETKVNLQVSPTTDTELPFLSFTICPAFGVGFNKTFLKAHGTNQTQFITKGQFVDLEKSDPKTWFHDATFDIEQLIQSVTVFVGMAAGNESITMQIQKDQFDYSIASFVEYFDTTFGRCFSMELKKSITRLSISSMILETHLDAVVYLHHPGQYQLVDSIAKVVGHVKKRYFLDVIYEITEDTLEGATSIPCSPDMNFKYDKCVTDALVDEMVRRYNCTSLWADLRRKPDAEVCVATSEELYQGFTEVENVMLCESNQSYCKKPCITMEVFLGVMAEGSNDDLNLANIKFYFKTSVRVKRSVYDYTLLSMVAEIGGYTGLLLGVSLVNVNKILFKVGNYVIRPQH